MSVIDIPTRGFARGAVVAKATGGPNMLVVRGVGARTVVVVCEADEDGTLRLREYLSADLVQIVESRTPADTPAKEP